MIATKEPTAERPLFLNQKRAATMIGVAPGTLSRWIAAGEVKATRRGGLVLVPATEIDRLLAEVALEAEPAGAAA